MRVVGVAAVSALLIGTAGWTAPARAQMGGGGEADKVKEKAYKESLRKIPDAKASNDPWGGVRSDAPKAAPAAKTSTAKAKTKTGSN
jgi:hypothetical protein